ncbi:hypothetical protein [Chromobacterium haemolyticum]|uniref:hypothetical protein n=1 Tax=Chromobacterium haemolyticum TaxID=394935 RepID=UPI0012FA2614|nr:hypothetical protein [Chromobacterium haemolyticum]
MAKLCKTAGIFKQYGVESDVVNFNGRLIVLYTPRTPDESNLLIAADYFTGDRIAVADFTGMSLGCAYMSGNILHYWATVNVATPGNKVVHRTTSDLINWSTPSDAWVAGHPQQKIFNTSVCNVGGYFVMAYETSEPYYGYVDFNIRFLSSTYLDGPWSPISGVFGSSIYVACPKISYANGYLYMHYLVVDNGVYKTKVARVSNIGNVGNMASWQISNSYALQPTLPEELINTSDIDFSEFNGTTYLTYAAGDQSIGTSNAMDLKQAYYPDTVANYLQSFFP